MRWGLSWGAQAPHHIEVMGTRYEVRTTKIAGVWTAYATVRGVCVEATGSSEREARQKWQKTVEAMTPLLDTQRRVERALDEAAAALDDAALDLVARDVAAERITAAESADNPPAASDSLAAESAGSSADLSLLYPETCENPRSVNRRLRPRLRREL